MINRIKDFDERSAEREHFEDKRSYPLLDSLNLRSVSDFARKHPVAVLTAGAALGLAVGWWVKRK